jgi:hypothetical protein
MELGSKYILAHVDSPGCLEITAAASPDFKALFFIFFF